MKANFKRAAIVTISCLFAALSWSDETANTANAAAARTVASANTGIKPTGVTTGAAHTAQANEPRAQRQPPAGVEVLRVVSDRDATTSDETEEASN